LRHNLFRLSEVLVIKLASLTRLFRTTTIRLAIRYSIYYVVLIFFILGMVYCATNDFVESYFQSRLERKFIEIINIENTTGRNNLIQTIKNENQIISEDNYLYYLLAPNGDKVVGSLLNWPNQLIVNGKVQKLELGSEFYSTLFGDEENESFWLMVAGELTDGSKLLVARYVDYTEEIQEFILFLMLMVIPLSGLLAIALGLLLGRTILKKIDGISTTAKAIAAGDFNNRVPENSRNDEFDELASHLNNMLSRIQKLIEGMRRVTDNIAHDLRSPLSRLRNQLEVTLIEKRKEPEYIEAIQSAIDESDHLINTFNALLEIAQTEAGNYRGDWNSINLSTLVYDIGKLYQDIAEDNGIVFDTHVEREIIIQGNRHLLAQAICNLLENAIKYINKDSHIRLSLNFDRDKPCLSISDNGPGIPTDKYEFILERFTRLDGARHSTGNGLGLSLVKAVADIHHAELNLLDNKPGLCVTLVFLLPEN
jgi:signal transduction histidine kinase